MDIIRRELTSQVLARALDGLSLRAQTIADNVANVDTPGFRAADVTFEADLQAALERREAARPPAGVAPVIPAATDARHFPLAAAGGSPAEPGLTGVTPRVVPLPGNALRRDGNNVDIDREMTRLAETQLSFSATTQLLGMKFQQLRQAIWEGRR
jgi:flagellar basal-body rod protein FlgB